MKNSFFFFPFILLMFLISCKKEKRDQLEFTVYQASGNIRPKLDAFKAALGSLNTVPKSIGGRREINWDVVPDVLLDKPLPGDFFNPTAAGSSPSIQRGLVYDDGVFEVSASAFSKLNPIAATEFQAFSGSKVFANVSSKQWPVGFQVPGEKTVASVSAFGAVFSDVDNEGSVTMEFFELDKSLGKFSVPAHDSSGSFSFVGVQFATRRVTKVVVSHDGFLADKEKDISQGGTKDLVVLDDFIYSEPTKQ
jgi:hypothetical protein